MYTNRARIAATVILGTAAAVVAQAAAAQGTTVTCESKNYRNEDCYAGGPVALVRQLSTPPGDCIEGRTWGYNRANRSIWVSNGCRAEFRVLVDEPASRPMTPGTTVTCESKNYRNAECYVNGGPVVLVRQLSTPPGDCIEGQTWGFNASNNAIWVSNGCRAEFRAGFAGSSSPHYVNGRYPGSDSIARQYYEYGYQHGREDAAANMSLVYERYSGEYDRRYERNFAQGYREGWNDQHAKADMNPVRAAGGIAYPPELDANAREYFRDGYLMGKADGLAHMSSVYQRYQDHYDSRFEDAFRRGYEQGWAAFRTR